MVDGVATQLRDLLGEEFLTSGRLGLAVSGGTDSLALALLASAAMPGRVAAATVDHGLQLQSAAWAKQTAAACGSLGIPHTILTIAWGESAPAANRQALARDARYHRLGGWLAEEGLDHLATAHHLDDQAETLLMRLDRGAGVGGLAGVRIRRLLMIRDDKRYECVRPLLFFRRAELERVIADAGLTPVDDPANRDPAHDRTRARAFLAASPEYPDRVRMAKSAGYLGEAERALEWAAGQLETTRQRFVDGAYELDVADVPPELRRRMAINIVRTMGTGCSEEPRGDVLVRAIRKAGAGEVATLANVVIRPTGNIWRFEWTPQRRDRVGND
jgi:tRNA(Ile)-lysidine synthase